MLLSEWVFQCNSAVFTELSDTDKNVSKSFPKRVIIWKAPAVKIACAETNSSIGRVSDAAKMTPPQCS